MHSALGNSGKGICFLLKIEKSFRKSIDFFLMSHYFPGENIWNDYRRNKD